LNSAGFVRIDTAGGPSEPIPTPIYASVRTVAEELLLTLRRSGRTVPSSPAVNPVLGMIDSFTAADYTGVPLVLDKSRNDVSHVSFKFETLPGVTFEIARVQVPQSEPGFDGAARFPPVGSSTPRFLKTRREEIKFRACTVAVVVFAGRLLRRESGKSNRHSETRHGQSVISTKPSDPPRGRRAGVKMGRVARRRRLGLGCSTPPRSLAPGPDLEGSRIVASSTPVRISVPLTEAPGRSA